jgi:hypothetical protein
MVSSVRNHAGAAGPTSAPVKRSLVVAMLRFILIAVGVTITLAFFAADTFWVIMVITIVAIAPVFFAILGLFTWFGTGRRVRGGIAGYAAYVGFVFVFAAALIASFGVGETLAMRWTRAEALRVVATLEAKRGTESPAFDASAVLAADEEKRWTPRRVRFVVKNHALVAEFGAILGDWTVTVDGWTFHSRL